MAVIVSSFFTVAGLVMILIGLTDKSVFLTGFIVLVLSFILDNLRVLHDDNKRREENER